ncbi:MAG: hypothetical protein WB992_11005 [Bryobacteraceae bacterium]
MTALSCAALVVSCDRYRDLWRPFFALFWRYWPDCPFPVYLGSNFETYSDERVTSLTAGEDESWSKNLRFFLNRLDSEYVLLLLEDFFLNRTVSTATLIDHLNALDQLGGSVLRLRPNPPPDIPVRGYPTIGSIYRFAPFRVSAQASIWKRLDLLALLRDGESAWEFERQATIRSQSRANGFFCTYAAKLPYRHVVEQGKWFWSAAPLYKKENIGCDFNARLVMGPFAAFSKVIHGHARLLKLRMLVRIQRAYRRPGR